MPFLEHLTQLTTFGLTAIALATVLYIATRLPEFLILLLTVAIYISAPQLAHMMG